MRILIDECLDWRLKRAFTGHAAMAVRDLGWRGIKNGALLSLVQSQFDLFITADQNLQFQQNIANYSIAIVVLQTASTRLQDTLPLVSKASQMLNQFKPGTVTLVGP